MRGVVESDFVAGVRDLRIAERAHFWSMNADTEWTRAVHMRAVKIAKPFLGGPSVRG